MMKFNISSFVLFKIELLTNIIYWQVFGLF